MTIGEAMKKARKDKKMTQTRLSELSGIGQVQISLYEHDNVMPTVFSAMCIADVLGVTLDELVGREVMK